MRHLALAALLAAGIACSGEPITPPVAPTSAGSTKGPAPEPPKFRLPATVVPTKVVATLTIVPAEDSFSGAVEHSIDVKEATRVVWLHQKGLTVSEASIESGGKKQKARVIPGGDSMIGIEVDEALAVGPAVVAVSYTGKVTSTSDRGVFHEKDGGNDYIFTQFENVHAREAFPCFDEPSFKVPWQLTIRAKAEDTVISNTPVIEEKKGDDGYRTVRFAETKPLPSYLVAFAVGPFEMIDAKTGGKNKTPIRFAVPKGRTSEATFAVESAGKVLDLLEESFGIPYPYKKLDYVIIPELASFGAMENAGIITSAARILLIKPEQDSPLFRKNAVLLMAHEAAHQWFGDLVTMAFWDDIWLNEGFATWMEEKIATRFDPSFGADVDRVHESAWIKIQDGLLSARKIRQEIESQDDIENAFDGITYVKGATIINMFEAWMGADSFMKGVRLYLDRFSHKNATSADFLAALNEGSKKDVKAAFSTFLDQPGIPIVSGKLACDAKGSTLSLTQERYLPLGSKGDAKGSVWSIPVCIHYGTGSDNATTCSILPEKAAEIAIKPIPGQASPCPDWLMLNSGGKGYYRVAYTAKDVATLLPKRNSPLSVSEKLSLLADVYSLAQNGRFPLGDALTLVPSLLKDDSAHIQGAGAMMSTLLRDDFVPDDLHPNVKRFLAKALEPRLRQLGIVSNAKEPPAVRELRERLLMTMAALGDTKRLFPQAEKLVDKWLTDPKAIDSDSVDGVLRIVVGRGDRALFDKLVVTAKSEKDPHRLQALLGALSGFRDPELVKASLALVLDGSFDPRSSMRLLWGQRQSSQLVLWDFVKANWDRLLAKLPPPVHPFLFLGPSRLCEEKHLTDAETFLKERAPKVTGAPRQLAQTLEMMSLCIARKEASKESLEAFLKKQ